jgi:hypothetical protein
MNYRVENFDLESELTEPIIVDDFRLYKNSYGRWCYSFDTHKQKFLVRGDEGLKGVERYISFESIDRSLVTHGEEYFTLPNSSISIWLIPENDEEAEEIDNVTYCVLPKGWGYHVLLLPEEDFQPYK